MHDDDCRCARNSVATAFRIRPATKGRTRLHNTIPDEFAFRSILVTARLFLTKLGTNETAAIDEYACRGRTLKHAPAVHWTTNSVIIWGFSIVQIEKN